MTMKSAARLARDQEEKNLKKGTNSENITFKKHPMPAVNKFANTKNHLKDNACWDELNSMYSSMCQLLGSHSALSEFAKDPILTSAVVDKELMITNLNILARDLQNMSTELSEISALHRNRTGGTRDPDQLMKTISIFEMYNLFMERHDAVVMPTAYDLVGQFNEAEQLLLKAQKAKEGLTDPNVISDVEIINIRTGETGEAMTPIEGEVLTARQSEPLDFEKLKNSFMELHPELSDIDQDIDIVTNRISEKSLPNIDEVTK